MYTIQFVPTSTVTSDAFERFAKMVTQLVACTCDQSVSHVVGTPYCCATSKARGILTYKQV